MRDGADHRRAGASARRDRRGRDRRRAEVAHDPGRRAVAQSLARSLAARARRRQIYFKYCSTFDSTARGNIGPVTDALLDALEPAATSRSPARRFRRTGAPSSRPSVRRRRAAQRERHAEPSADADDRCEPRARAAARRRRRKVGLVRYDAVARARCAIRERIDELRDEGVAHRDRRRGLERGSVHDRRCACGDCRWSPPARASRSACRRTPARRLARAPTRADALPAVEGARRCSRAAARRRRTRRWRASSTRAARLSRSIRSALAAATSRRDGARVGRAAHCATTSRCWSTRPPRRTK